MHGHLFNGSDSAGFYSNDFDEMFVATKLTEEKRKQSYRVK
jgi:Zn-dependent oligopeptidase